MGGENRIFRPHQVRAHAATHGIPVIGDALYGAEALPAPITRAQGRKRVELTQETADAALPIHLQRVCLADGRTLSAVSAPFSALATAFELAGCADGVVLSGADCNSSTTRL